jgi:hypothetical protein
MDESTDIFSCAQFVVFLGMICKRLVNTTEGVLQVSELSTSTSMCVCIECRVQN